MTSDALAEAVEHHHLGVNALAQEEIADAVRHLSISYELYRGLDRGEDAASELLYLGLAEEASGQVSKARGRYEEAVETYRKVGAPYEAAGALERLAALEEQAGNLSQAREAYRQAAELASESGAAGDAARLEAHARRIDEPQPDASRPRLYFFANDRRRLQPFLTAGSGRVVGTSFGWASVTYVFSLPLDDELDQLDRGDTFVYVLPTAQSEVPVSQIIADARALERRGARVILLALSDSIVHRDLDAYDVVRLHGDDAAANFLLTLEPQTSVDLAQLSGRDFERLVEDLLRESGFRVEAAGRTATHADFLARSSVRGPLGLEDTLAWAVEVKGSRGGQASDLRGLHQLLTFIERHPAVDRGLYITDGELTSVARDWLSSEAASARLRVIEGPQLVRLLQEHPRVVRRWLGPREAS